MSETSEKPRKPAAKPARPPKSPEEQREKAIRKSLERVRFLIADTGSSRTSIQRMLSHFEVKRANIEVAASSEEARAIIAKTRPQVVFAEFEIAGKPGLELVKFHTDALELQMPRAFILILNKNSNMLVSSAADDPVDSLLVRPFTFQGLKNQFMDVVEQRVDPNEYHRAVSEGARHFEEGRLDQARSIFEQAANLDPSAVQAHAYLGVVLHRQGRYDEAVASFNRSLKIDPQYFKGLMGLFDTYLALGNIKGAYETGKWIAHHHPLPLRRLPDFIRVSISNNRLKDILGFYELTGEVEFLPVEIARSIAAGLAVCGLQFIKAADKENAIGAFKRALTLSRWNPLIVKRVLCALIEAGYVEEYTEHAAKAPPEVAGSLEVRVAEIRHWERKEDLYRALKLGLESIAQGVHDADLFRRMILLSSGLKRNAGTIRELIELGARKYPEMAASFRSLFPDESLAAHPPRTPGDGEAGDTGNAGNAGKDPR